MKLWIISLAFALSFNSLAEGKASQQKDIISYCISADCDYYIFHKYYEKNAPRFCFERNLIINDERKRSVLSFVLKEIEKSSLDISSIVIPIMESSLSPNEVSGDYENAAAGLWQFKPATARDVGLIVNDLVDERFDIKKSTKAAIKYLEWLDKKFDGKHNLTVLAYHVGVGRLSRKIKETGIDNPWYLSQMFQHSAPDKNYLMKYHAYTLSLMNKGC